MKKYYDIALYVAGAFIAVRCPPFQVVILLYYTDCLIADVRSHGAISH